MGKRKMLKSSSSDSTPSSIKPMVCIILLPEGYVPKENRNENDGHIPIVESKQLGYVGTAKNRYYAIHEIEFNEILLITSIKYKIDSNSLYEANMPSTKVGFGVRTDIFKHANPMRRSGK